MTMTNRVGRGCMNAGRGCELDTSEKIILYLPSMHDTHTNLLLRASHRTHTEEAVEVDDIRKVQLVCTFLHCQRPAGRRPKNLFWSEILDCEPL
jgi:hypothetical protein